MTTDKTETSCETVDTHVSFKGVGKSFDGKAWAVRDLDLQITRGEFLTLLGPSGSGKTTTLMMLAGFETPTAGEISIDSRRIDRTPANRRGIGLVFQDYALFPHMTVAENLAFPLQARKYPRAEIEKHVKHILDMVQLSNMESRRPDQLSGGQQQRVALARALIFEPKLVLMDEPLGALDKKLREQMQFELKHTHDRLGVTFIYVTHDQTEALTMSDRVAVFNEGVIQQVSTPDGVYERPETSFVANFIGENNCITGTVVGSERQQEITIKLESGKILKATPRNVDTNPGIKALVTVRPERAVIDADPGEYPNGLKATIVEIVYVGDHIRIVLDSREISGFVVKISNESKMINVQKGQDVRIGWRIKDCLVFDITEQAHLSVNEIGLGSN
ncbi:MAG: ABC transporter ATP-binding protein [Desulfobacterales bacterium]|nr:MAG: ABC transporter ATP-binding protein [Desulfobacterales bacterium]